MPKMTIKYTRALTIARESGLPVTGDQEVLYKRLNENGLWWDSKQGQWINFENEPANEPSPKVMIRVWAAEGQISQAVSDVIKGLRGKYKFISRSDPYPCRPPKQREIRVHLEFLPGDDTNLSLDEIIKENDPFAVEVE